jgi:hypothetical protein
MKLHSPWSWRDHTKSDSKAVGNREDVAGLLGLDKDTRSRKHRRRFSFFTSREQSSKKTSLHKRSKSAGSSSTQVTVSTGILSYANEDTFDLTCIDPAYADGSSLLHPMTPVNVLSQDQPQYQYEEAMIIETISAEFVIDTFSGEFEEALIQEMVSDVEDVEENLSCIVEEPSEDEEGLSCIVEETSEDEEGLSCIVEETSDDAGDVGAREYTEQHIDKSNHRHHRYRKSFYPFPPEALSDNASPTAPSLESIIWDNYGQNEYKNDGSIHDVVDYYKNTRGFNPSSKEMALMDADSSTLSGNVWTEFKNKDSDFLYPGGLGNVQQIKVTGQTNLTYDGTNVNDVISPQNQQTVDSIFDCPNHGKSHELSNLSGFRCSDAAQNQEARDSNIEHSSERKSINSGVEEYKKETDSVDEIMKPQMSAYQEDDMSPANLWNQMVDTMAHEYTRAMDVISGMNKEESDHKTQSVFDLMTSIFIEKAEPVPESKLDSETEDDDNASYVEI